MKRVTLLILAAVGLSAFAGDTGWVFQPRYTRGTSNPSATATAGNVGSLYFNTANNSVWIKVDDFVTKNWLSITGGAGTQTFFANTCAITSAAATTPISCLAAGSVGTSQVAHVTGFHGAVSGATSWATTAACTLEDTNGSPVIFASVAVSAMTGNAYIEPATSGVTLSNPYLRNTGATAGKGLQVVCDANGTGSTFYLTVQGYLH